MKRFFKDEKGASAIIIAFAMTFILAVSALVMDIGAAYVDASSAQNAADAIALSIGKYLPVEENDVSKKAIIINTAKEYALKNKVDGFDSDNLTFGDLSDGKYKSVSVTVTRVSITRLAGIIGVDNIEINKSASVSAVPAGTIRGAVPMGISEEAYDTAMETGQYEHVKLKVGGGGGENGFFGFLVLDDSNGNANVLEQWFKFGYPGTNSLGDTLRVATGNMTSVARNGVDYRLSQCNHYAGQGGCTPEHYDNDCSKVIYVLIYRMVDSKNVEVTGFAAFLLEESVTDDEILGTFLFKNTAYSDLVAEKDYGVYTYRLTG
jgi:hypothetical protein